MSPRIAWLFLLTAIAAPAGLNDDLMAAARHGDAAAVKALLDKGAEVDTKTPYGSTPLYHAAMNGHAEVVKLLAERGADVNVRDTFYKGTPLAFAAQKGHYRVVEVLLEKGASAGENLLPAAAREGQVNTVRLALAKTKPKAETLSTALDAASKSGKTEIVELLKQAGAQPLQQVNVDAETLKIYQGIYRSDSMPLVLRFTPKDGTLTVVAEGQPEFTMIAVSPTTFRVPAIGLTCSFETEDGRVKQMNLQQGGASLVFKKVDK